MSRRVLRPPGPYRGGLLLAACRARRIAAHRMRIAAQYRSVPHLVVDVFPVRTPSQIIDLVIALVAVKVTTLVLLGRRRANERE